MGSLRETNPSLWVGTAEATRFHELHGDMNADVVVVGAGIAGLTAAALLKGDGRRVVVVEAGRVCSGVTAYTTRNGSAAGVMLADRIAGRENPFADFFDSTRLNPRQSMKELVKENANVVKRFVGDRLRTETRSVADLAPGEAAVLVVGTERVAAYRDGAGTVHAVSPVCTHLGCTVAWNTAETTRDCPCHGSRFTVDGQVVQGPAVKDLEPREVGA